MPLLPDFLIIGVQKGGTTSLYRYLLQHPQVAPAATKEVHFFDLHYGQGLDWYRAQFPELGSRRGDRPVLTGEASPYYVFHPLAAQRIQEVMPTAKLIVLLRNPVDRALSHYFHEVRWGFETLDLEAALACEGDRLAGEAERMLDDGSYQSFNYQHYSYLKRGRYGEQLKGWRSRFSASQILVLCSEQFYENPAATLDRVTAFLGLEPFEFGPFEAHNAGDYAPPEPGQRAQLQAYFQPHNEQLWRYLRQEWPHLERDEFLSGRCWDAIAP
ncbi:MAG: sulfotransferase [Cyanophyceae cyanobacterium]